MGSRVVFALAIMLYIGGSYRLNTSFPDPYAEEAIFPTVIVFLLFVVFLWSALARCAAIGWSRWRVLILVIPMVSILAFGILLTRKSAKLSGKQLLPPR